MAPMRTTKGATQSATPLGRPRWTPKECGGVHWLGTASASGVVLSGAFMVACATSRAGFNGRGPGSERRQDWSEALAGL